MSRPTMITVDGNEACASVAYRLSEVAAIYPITPSSNMGEWSDEWSAQGRTNLWGDVPQVVEMQSEAGAAGACHGAIQAGSLGTTFTASQGLLLMIPNMYKIAGELTPFVIHVSARTVATHALSIFGDHSDVMACRQTGFAMLAAGSVQEAHDMAAVAHSASLKSRLPFLHFFDGFRTSHEVNKVAELSDDDLKALVSDDLVRAHRARAMTPDAPVLRGTSQNPDAFFQGQEARNPFYDATPEIVQQTMDDLAARTGRRYSLFDYSGAPDAERVIVIMGSGGETVEETVNFLAERGEKVGVIRVRLFRPFSVDAFVSALPVSTRSIAVMDRTKESGTVGEPLFLDVVGALHRARAKGLPTVTAPVVVGGRYGLSSKEFTPAMVKAVFDELAKPEPMPVFTVGITDDVTHLSLDVDSGFSIEPADVERCLFFGLGADGTVGANKNSIKIICEGSDLHGQGYFVYDSKKSGGNTISHLRFGPRPIRAPYLVSEAGFIACHHFEFLDKQDVLAQAANGATFLLNSPFNKDEVWDELPAEVQKVIVERNLRFYVIDANSVAGEVGMGRRINTIMQACFFALSGVLPRDEAITRIKDAIAKTYARKSQAVIEANFAAVDQALNHLEEVSVPSAITGHPRPPAISPRAPEFVQKVCGELIAGRGDDLPVSAFPIDGTWPTGTAKWEKRNIALEVCAWDAALCTQCNKCVMICPHGALRAATVDDETAQALPETMQYKPMLKGGGQYVFQISAEDCTGCTLCVEVCPGVDKENPERRALVMQPKTEQVVETARANWEAFETLPAEDRSKLRADVRSTQLMTPLFEFSGACAGCGETPYLKLITQLWGDRLLIANATGCSSIYGGNLPTTPFTTNADGRGPTWSNSLFEDNAEFGLGFRVAIDQHRTEALRLLGVLAGDIPGELVEGLMAHARSLGEVEVAEQRRRVVALRQRLAEIRKPEARLLESLADYLVEKVVWAVGGDGWAYDIGYGGLDHVLSSGRNVNLLVMDTEVYSNTGGQQSKATPIAASAKFAVAGKALPKKDLGMIAISNGHVYVASIASAANDAQTVKALNEAVSYDGPSVIIAYSHCIAHGYDLSCGIGQQKLAVQSGYWPMYRYDPRKLATGKAPLTLDSKPRSRPLADYMAGEGRFQVTAKADPEGYKKLLEKAEREVDQRYNLLRHLAGLPPLDAEANKGKDTGSAQAAE
ncbi:pyruvate:ferredoxin (flavodoxin) oxidoreductase [Roseospirillum parvum]|uniref:Pyruvate-flavodoxin oxidoreductase n=1 Tax=Roseospirillum parvum TaxID=83401 RepID=A0A1G7ZGK3_9PROT|nr:pyruvate:ferredoxin (flavodoxin) oxidoreductase [Roseospirillum parvum]SDH07863.1 pyruvate-ferredoxin/flavodoxin oxidoreductase [Roseospirillum parvum]